MVEPPRVGERGVDHTIYMGVLTGGGGSKASTNWGFCDVACFRGIWCSVGRGMLYVFGKPLKRAFRRCMGWGGGGVGNHTFCEIWLRLCKISVFLPCFGLVADWLHNAACVLTLRLWWVNWWSFSGNFMGFHGANPCTQGANPCEGTNTHFQPFYLAFTATSSHLPHHDALGQFLESSLRQAEQKHGYLPRRKRPGLPQD